MEGHCSTGQSPQWAVVPMEEEDVQRNLPLSPSFALERKKKPSTKDGVYLLSGQAHCT